MCDTVVALTDSGVLFAKNSDRDANEAQLMEWLPAAEHDAGASVGCTYIDIPQVARTNAVLLSRPYWMWGAEIGANEHGVVIGNEAVFTKAKREGKALLGMDLLRLALERAASARDAVQVIVSLLEAHGQGGPCSVEHPKFTYHNSFLVADSAGAYVLETAGREHAVEHVRGPARAISNALTIPGFADKYADRLRGRVARAARRRSCLVAHARLASSPADLMAGLRDHGPGGLEYSWASGALGAPCAHAGGRLTATQTTASWVADIAGGVHWVTGTSAPCTSVFWPARVEASIDLGPAPGATFDPEAWWWRHELLHRAVMRDPARLGGMYRDEVAVLEREFGASSGAGASDGGVIDSERAVAAVRRSRIDWLRRVRSRREADTRPRFVQRLWHGYGAAARAGSGEVGT